MNELLESCPICGGTDLPAKLQVQDKSVSQETFTIAQCAGCGLQFTNPRPDAAHIGRYYESAAYVSHNSAAQGLVNRVYRMARFFTMRHKVALITKLNGGRTGRLLDYGCGTGHFLARAKSAGWQVTGLEPNPGARQDAAARVGQPILEVSALTALPPASFDIVTLWHVLEHVHTLNETLTQLVAALRPGGRLLIAVPNPDSLDAQYYRDNWAAYDVPRHLYHFVPDTMRRLLARHGLRITHTLPLMLDAYYVSMLSEQLRTPAQPVGPLVVLRAGLRSNQYAAQNGGQYSSLLYVAERAAG
ncbi:class I SAM-dependent methyltransferase [Hymenobacter sp. UV11]|uniref:class I SAM-dependent methyltransferase n=1 Tax=Hymenobacter sp. UV11 TaxID=1849735 RepID=UPI00105BBFBA|nr:class I SAM-dependent methyltransferase [Hymenobacter sp. UV11]TDN40027.1 methyltransferase [Hymenobacter sp. UV11]TFZ64060.1 class I SAM-dependent methyltransferase [Hymenobacter sp. UV11]